jgi:hypothetical protein
MLAANLVYATVVGRYPRLLGDDGIHEPLVLPYDLDANVPFQFYRENDRVPLNTAMCSTLGISDPTALL